MSNDTKTKTTAKFVAVLEFTETSRARVPIHADTLAEGRHRNGQLASSCDRAEGQVPRLEPSLGGGQLEDSLVDRD